MNEKKKKILILGCSGRLGGFLKKKLDGRNYKIIYHEGKTGGKTWTIKELEEYISSRAKRGRVLPTGYNGMIKLEEVEKTKDAAPE